MKALGLMICLMGTTATVAYPPYKLLGHLEWNFIWEDIVAAFGHSVPVKDYVDVQTLLMELLVINLIGVALILVGRK